jgi:allantoin racemase
MSEEEVLQPLIKAGEQARMKGAEVLILGCAGLAGYDEKLSKKINLPVIDPVKAGVKLAESILQMGLTISRAGLFSKLVHSEW